MSNVDPQGRWITVQRPTERRMSIICLQAGQARPYGDSWYRYRVTFLAGVQEGAKAPLRLSSMVQVMAAVQPLIGETLYWQHEAPSAFSATITTCEETEPGVWLIEARALYND